MNQSDALRCKHASLCPLGQPHLCWTMLPPILWGVMVHAQCMYVAMAPPNKLHRCFWSCQTTAIVPLHKQHDHQLRSAFIKRSNKCSQRRGPAHMGSSSSWVKPDESQGLRRPSTRATCTSPRANDRPRSALRAEPAADPTSQNLTSPYRRRPGRVRAKSSVPDMPDYKVVCG
jgi:hypothetical protein